MKSIRCKNQLGNFVEILQEKFTFRPSAYGLIMKDDHILLMKNKLTGKYWFPGGGIHMHERLEEGLLREIKEEVNIDVSIVQQLFVTETYFYYEPEDLAMHTFLFFFHCLPVGLAKPSAGSEPDFDLDKSEWIPIHTLEPEHINDMSESQEMSKKVCEYLKKLIILPN